MTLVEFVAPVRTAKNQDRVLAVLYFEHRHSGREALTAAELRTRLRDARIPKFAKINVADVLGKSGHLVENPESGVSPLFWRLTESGQAYVRKALGLPAVESDVEQDVSSLGIAAAAVADEDTRGYLDEGIKCLQAGARRAAVVFLWTGAIRLMQSEMLASGEAKLNAALKTHDPKARQVATIDDFSYVKDKIALLAARDLGLIDKSEKDTLQEGLDLRNRCGHPGKYRPGEKKVSGFIDDLIQIAFA